MRKILILDDDYNELTFLETFFKKMGFDVIGIQKPQLVEKTVLGFIPQLFIVSYPSRNFDAIEVFEKVRRNSAYVAQPPGLLGLIRGKRAQVPKGVFHEIVESPIALGLLITSVAKLLKMDEKALATKFASLQSAVSENKQQVKEREQMEIIRSGGKSGFPMNFTEPTPGSATRVSKYDSYIKSAPPRPGKTLLTQDLRKHSKKLSESDQDSASMSQKETLAFLKAMFSSEN